MRTKQKNRNAPSEKEKSKYRVLMDEHPILFARNKLPMNQTCMCWGIEAGEGWHTPLRDLCDILETLNLTVARKFGLVIRAEQVKEKYGTLRFSYFIDFIPSLWRKILALPFDGLAWIFGKKEFKSERIDKKDEPNGYKVIWHPRWRHWLFNRFYSISSWIKYAGNAGYKTSVVTGALQRVVDKLIEDAEHECYCTCEDCGHQIGTEWSPRCETQGWINYLCKECAEKRNVTYSLEDVKTGELKYFNGNTDITKDILKQRRQMEKSRSKKKDSTKKKEEKKETRKEKED